MLLVEVSILSETIVLVSVCVSVLRLATYCKFQMSEFKHSLRNVHFKHCSIGMKNITGSIDNFDD